MKLSNNQIALLKECCQYNISDYGKQYYRLGGYGFARIRYNHRTLRVLKENGLVEYKGYWVATEAGKELVDRSASE